MQDKISDLGWSVLPHPPYLPDLVPSDFHLFLFSTKYSEWQKLFSRSDENICGKLFQLKINWILLERNQQAIQASWSMAATSDSKYWLIEINSMLNYLWINYILLKQKLFMTQPNRNQINN